MLEPELSQTIAEALGIPPETVGEETGRETLADWDSLAHLRVILAVEKKFRVRFRMSDIPELTSAGAIGNALRRLRAQA